ncbi:MAG: hypothetical protein NC123_04370 [Butyrivibrio sp.]|nr:hypothetical protein [Acetatifactor muris]MCM1558763.1 hypothetical protein [Butyrivibrio sp.]
MKKAGRHEKCISKFITYTLLAVSLIIVCPSFSITSKAASDTSTWSIPTVSSQRLYRKDTGSAAATRTLNFDLDTSVYNAALSTYQLPDTLDTDKQLVITYPSFAYTLTMTAARANYPNENQYQNNASSLLSGLKPYLVDNLGNTYPLDAENGGTITIEDISNITTLSLKFLGTVSGTITFTPSGYSMRYVNVLGSVSSFDMTLSLAAPARTITDMEGTVWTLADDVENPVVIQQDSDLKLLLDVSDLKYIPGRTGYYIVSEYIKTVCLYRPDGSIYAEQPLNSLVSNIFPEYTSPLYTTSLKFDGFLYNSLPEYHLNSEPSPTPAPVPDGFEEIGIDRYEVDQDDGGYVVIWDSSQYQVENNYYVEWEEPVHDFSIYSSKKTMESVDTTNSLYHAHFDENSFIVKYLYEAPSAPYDGYCVVSFPKGIYAKIVNGGLHVPSDGSDITSWHYQVDIIPYLLAQGIRYELTDNSSQFSFPVYQDNSFSFEIGYEIRIRADVQGTVPRWVQYGFDYEVSGFPMSLWYYIDTAKMSQIVDELKTQTEESKKQTEELKTQTEESKKQTEALTKFEGSDKMDSDNDALGGAISDYNEVSDSLFASADSSLSDFDITSSFNFGGGLLSAISLLSTILTQLILAMGDFSMIYTIGVCLVIAGIILGLWKFKGGGGDK